MSHLPRPGPCPGGGLGRAALCPGGGLGGPCPRAGRRLGRAALLALGALALASCSSSPSAQGAAPHALLDQAKSTLDATRAVHFTLSSSGAQGAGASLVGAVGDVARPDAFRGTLMLSESGATLDVKAVSVGGKVYAQLPFTSHYALVNPSQFGLSDPARLIDPNTGISSLLTSVTTATVAPAQRYQGEILDEVNVTLPAAKVASVLDTSQRSGQVTGTVGIDPSSHQMRRVTLTGRLLQRGSDTTYTLVLDNYGETLDITAPPT